MAAGFAGGLLACHACRGQSEEDYADTFRGVNMNRDLSERIEARPGLRLGTGWHSNPYLRPSSESIADAWVLDVDPYLDVECPFSEYLYLGVYGKLNLKYFYFDDPSGVAGDDTLEYRSFADYHDENSLIVQPFIAGKLRHNPSEYTSLALYDDFQSANVDRYGTSDRFYLNNAWAEAVHEFSDRTSGKVQYRHVWHNQNDDPDLFNFQDHAVSAALPRRLAILDEGRAVILTPQITAGRRAFDQPTPSFEAEDSSSREAKDYDYLDTTAGLLLPLSSLVTLNLSGGWGQRQYEKVVAGSDRSDAVHGGATLSLTPSPGSPLTFVLAGTREVTDTVIYNTAEYNRLPFEWEDATLNELNITYRELDVSRLGTWIRYDVTEFTRAYLVASFQRAEGDAENDLAGTEGYTESTGDREGRPEPTCQEEWVFGGGLRARLTETVEAGLSYRHGLARDNERTASERDLYEYDEVSLKLSLVF